MKPKFLNKKGIAILLVSVLIVCAVPAILVMINLTSSQKKQSLHLDSTLKLEQIALSGTNYGYLRLKDPEFKPNFQSFSDIIIDSNEPKDSFDLSLRNTGYGFFNQNIYMSISKSEKIDPKGNNQTTIIVSDTEQFQTENLDNVAFVITHDYWSTQDNHDIKLYDDYIALRNKRGTDQLRSLEVKEFEMSTSNNEFIQKLNELKDKVPPSIQICWQEVVNNMKNDKINGSNYIPSSNENDNPTTQPGTFNSDDPNTNDSNNPNNKDTLDDGSILTR